MTDEEINEVYKQAYKQGKSDGYNEVYSGVNDTKKMINVLGKIEKDLDVIASNTEAFRMRYVVCDDPGPKGQLGHPNVSKKQDKEENK